MKCSFKICLMLIVSCVGFSVAHAQETEEASDLDVVESELKRLKETSTSEEEPVLKQAEVVEKSMQQDVRLQTLAPFEDVSVIQRRFLPKTGRLQAYGALTSILNDPWFSGVGVNARLAYNFTEAWALEANSYFLSSSESQDAKKLFSENDVTTSTFIKVKSYMGALLVWTPIYGKFSQFTNRIIPFDMYFTVGGGSASIENGTGGSSIQFGTGQIFAITKALGLRWDLTFNSLSATQTGSAAKTYNNVIWSVGMSFFFPEAKYR